MSPRSPSPADPPILLVEDKDSLRAMLRHALEAQGHTVVEARDQPEAETALQSSHPAVVLSDLRLPEGDGFGVLRASKELDPQLPVIVMTAFGNPVVADRARRLRADVYLEKPFRLAALVDEIRRVGSHGASDGPWQGAGRSE